MAKKSNVVTTTAEDELNLLRARIAELEEEKSQRQDDTDGRYLREMQSLKKSQATGLNTIQQKDIQDYKAVCLWHVSGHNVGKRVGPLHPANAEDTFMMFAGKGIKLSMQKPTLEFIEAYKKTDEYKKAAEIEAKRRAAKDRSRKESEVEKLTQAIGKMTGKLVVNEIKNPQEVGTR
jgi:hypothetical protein